MDEGQSTWVSDSLWGVTDKWLWVKGPEYELAAGRHTHLFPSPTAWCGGALLDKIALIPLAGDAIPSGVGPEPCDSTLPQEGKIASNSFRINDFEAWRLDYEKEENGETVEVEYSYDRGKTWSGADRALREVPPGVSRLILRLRMKAQKGKSPRIRDVMLYVFPVAGTDHD
jgi:hypothetical protein